MLEFRKNARESVVLRLDIVEGHDVADIRIWTPTYAGEMVPTPKGITLRIQQLPELADAVATLTAEAKAKGMLPVARPI